MARALRRDWKPGAIGPKPGTVAVSIRVPRDLYQELGRYAKRVRAPRSYLVVECLRRLLAANGVRKPRRAARGAR